MNYWIFIILKYYNLIGFALGSRNKLWNALGKGRYTAVDLHISEEWERFIRAEIESGRYSSEREVVEESLRLLPEREREQGPKTEPSAGGDQPRRKPIWEVLQEITTSIPEEEWAKLPADGAEQHDHYIYGTPKRPTS
jgi:putative addiction module CopG family antidote